MPTPNQQELDRRIQHSLVDRVRHASRDYRTASAPLEVYLAALEELADYVGARCQQTRPVLQFPLAKPSARRTRSLPKQENSARVIPFAARAQAGGSPFPAA